MKSLHSILLLILYVGAWTCMNVEARSRFLCISQMQCIWDQSLILKSHMSAAQWVMGNLIFLVQCARISCTWYCVQLSHVLVRWNVGVQTWVASTLPNELPLPHFWWWFSQCTLVLKGYIRLPKVLQNWYYKQVPLCLASPSLQSIKSLLWKSDYEHDSVWRTLGNNEKC